VSRIGENDVTCEKHKDCSECSEALLAAEEAQIKETVNFIQSISAPESLTARIAEYELTHTTGALDRLIAKAVREAELNAKIAVLAYWKMRTSGRSAEDMHMLHCKLLDERAALESGGGGAGK